jgi:hypothetical protein
MSELKQVPIWKVAVATTLAALQTPHVEAGAYLEGSCGLPTPIPRASRAGPNAYSATARIGVFLSPAAVVGFLIQRPREPRLNLSGSMRQLEHRI